MTTARRARQSWLTTMAARTIEKVMYDVSHSFMGTWPNLVFGNFGHVAKFGFWQFWPCGQIWFLAIMGMCP